jgi:hypothetical protein
LDSIVWNESQNKSFCCAIATEVTIRSELVTQAKVQRRSGIRVDDLPKESRGGPLLLSPQLLWEGFLGQSAAACARFAPQKQEEAGSGSSALEGDCLDFVPVAAPDKTKLRYAGNARP